VKGLLKRAISIVVVSALTFGLVFSRPAPASASIFSLGQLMAQINQINQLLNSPYGNLSITNGGLTGIFQTQYPGVTIPGTAEGVNAVLSQLIRNELGSSLGSMQSGGNQIQNALFGYGNSLLLDAAAGTAATAGLFFPNPNPSLYVQNEIQLAAYNAQVYGQASQSAQLQALSEYNASQAQIQAMGVAAVQENYTTFDASYAAYRARGY
jgi:hypothetical protein